MVDCNSPVYLGFIRLYAIVMIFVYPIGVPFYYAITIFRNKEQLADIKVL